MLLQRKRLIARMHQTINASRVFVVFCKPILATWLHRKRLLARMHLAAVFCKPILAMLLQRKQQAIINASHVFVVFCKPILAISCSPNEDLGSRTKDENADVRGTFQWFVAQIKHTHTLEKYLQNAHFSSFVLLPKSKASDCVHLACWLCL